MEEQLLQCELKTEKPSLSWKLWLYTNYDCNLRCTYCVAKSSPNAPRRALGQKNVQRLIDEAVNLEFDHIFFTGGEPFILKDIYDMLSYSSSRLKTSVLTNGLLLKGWRLDRLCEIDNENLILQVSLDGGRAEHNDAYRGKGTWQKTVEAIQRLQERGFRVRLSTTETPANTDHLDEICELHHSWGIPEQDHFFRPLAKRGNSKEGLELGIESLIPEITVNIDGIFWHPLSTDADMLVNRQIFPLSTAVERVEKIFQELADGNTAMMDFT